MRFAGGLPRERITITAGKFAVFDIFDDNRYAHDPRTQFLNWAFASAGAFDFANDAKGFTNGVALEWDNGGLGAARPAPSRWPSGSTASRSIRKPLRGYQLLAQVDRFCTWAGRPGALRLLGGCRRPGRSAGTRWSSGDITATEVSPGGASTVKTMAVLNWEQELRDDLGAFARLSWNDGRTQNWMYTEMDWAVSAGLCWTGQRWGRAGGCGGARRQYRRAVADATGASWKPAGSASSPATAG